MENVFTTVTPTPAAALGSCGDHAKLGASSFPRVLITTLLPKAMRTERIDALCTEFQGAMKSGFSRCSSYLFGMSAGAVATVMVLGLSAYGVGDLIKDAAQAPANHPHVQTATHAPVAHIGLHN